LGIEWGYLKRMIKNLKAAYLGGFGGFYSWYKLGATLRQTNEIY